MAEWTDTSQAWQRKASSASQNHRARRRRQPSQGRAVLAPTALAGRCFSVHPIAGEEASALRTQPDRESERERQRERVRQAREDNASRYSTGISGICSWDGKRARGGPWNALLASCRSMRRREEACGARKGAYLERHWWRSRRPSASPNAIGRAVDSPDFTWWPAEGKNRTKRRRPRRGPALSSTGFFPPLPLPW